MLCIAQSFFAFRCFIVEVQLGRPFISILVFWIPHLLRNPQISSLRHVVQFLTVDEGMVGGNAELREVRSVFVCKMGEQAPEMVAPPKLTLQNVNSFINTFSGGGDCVLQGSYPDTALSRWI